MLKWPYHTEIWKKKKSVKDKVPFYNVVYILYDFFGVKDLQLPLYIWLNTIADTIIILSFTRKERPQKKYYIFYLA